MFIIEPCCTQRHWPAFRDGIRDGGTAFFRGCGDLSLTELLPAILARYDDVEVTVAAPSLPDSATATLLRWLEVRYPRMDGCGVVYAVARMTLVADLSPVKSPMASRWLEDNPFGGRLELRDVQQNDTAIVLPDIAVYGGVNMAYGSGFTAAVTKDAGLISDLRSLYHGM